MTFTVGIAGAGVLGRLLALELARGGCAVTLFDRNSSLEESSCSWVGAGMLAPMVELDVAEPTIAHWGLRALERWPQILANLASPVYFQREGSLVVAHRQDRAELLRLQRCLSTKWPSEKPFRTVAGDALLQLEPELAERFQHALYFPTEGQLEPRQLMPALLKAAEDAGVQCQFQCEITRVGPGEIGFAGKVARFDWAIDTRGMGARRDLPKLRGVRGEILRLYAPEVTLRRPVRLMHPRYPLYIVPRPGRQFLIGATNLESDAASGVTVRSALELLSAAYSVHPGFAEAEITDLQTQVRPAFPDHLPKMMVEPGLLRINGLYRHGFLLSPVLVQVAQTYLMTGKKNESLWKDVEHARNLG